MGKVVEGKKKKKKGRPSLLDLQKRTLKEQEELHQNQNHPNKRNNNSAPHSTPNYKPATAPVPTPVRRSTRRNPDPEVVSPEDNEDGDELDGGRRREKKLKLVLRLPSQKSPSQNSQGSDSNAEGERGASNHRKRKINAIGDGSGIGDSEKGEKSISGSNPTNNFQGTQIDSGPSTPLPDKHLLLFILDRLQKKDSYGVFSEPVDPKELPDYHEVIEHPMDFSTVRKKLTAGVYANLEQLENDVFLICSNAMQYNAPDTIYFRQARSIQELAKKSFENLRQDSDDNVPEPKIVRRGRPPTKNLKKPLGRPSMERAGSEFSSDATLATGGENTIRSNHDMRKGPLSEKSGFADSSGRFINGSRNNDVYTGLLAENKFERNDEFTGSVLKGSSIRQGKKQFFLSETKRKTYKQSHSSVEGRDPSVFTTFDGERKQLMAVGLHSEYGYARSLARFAVNLGPVAWRIAMKKIERTLPPGVKFGPGWVGENDVTPQRPLVSPSTPPGQLPLQPSSVTGNLPSAATPCTIESIEDEDISSKNPEPDNSKHEPLTHTALDCHLTMPPPAAPSSSQFPTGQSSETDTEKVEVVKGLNSHSGFSILNNSTKAIRSRPPFQINQGRPIHPGMNGLNGAYGLNLPVQMGKHIPATRAAGFNLQSSQILNSRTSTNFVQAASANKLKSEDSLDNYSKKNTDSSQPNSGSEVLIAPTSGHHQRPSWQGLSPQQISNSGLYQQQNPDSVPPDLNVRFQSPSSPSCTRVDSTQPDLALQL